MMTRTAILALCAAALIFAAGRTALAQNKPITGITISLPPNPDANTKLKKNKGTAAKSATTASKTVAPRKNQRR